MEAPSRKSGLSPKPKANVGTKASDPRHATKSGQVDGQKSTKPASSDTQNENDNHVLKRVRRRSTGSSSIVFGDPTISQKSSGGRAPIDRHEYVDDPRSSSTKNKNSSSNVKIAANHLSPPNVPSHSLFGGFQGSSFGNRNASPPGFSAFGSRKSDNIFSNSPSVFKSSKDEGQNELFAGLIFGKFREPVKGQRKCTFKVPRGKTYTLWLSYEYDVHNIVSDGTLYRNGRTLLDRGGKSLTELEPDLPDKVRACEIRDGQNTKRFWLDFVHRGREQHKNFLRKRRGKPVAKSDEEHGDEESEAEEDENSEIEDEENDDNNNNNDDDDDDGASEDDNSNDDTSESGECDIRESEKLMIDLEKIDIEQLKSEGLEVDMEKLGRNYRVGYL